MNTQKIIGALAIAAVILIYASAFVVDEREQVFITQFGEPMGEPITEAGIHFKIPIIQDLHSYEKRFLEWDGDPNQVPTKDKKFIQIDTFARWRILNPLVFFQKVTDELGAQTRLDDVLDGATRSVIAGNNLVEIVRSFGRQPQSEDSADVQQELELLDQVSKGRSDIAKDVLTTSQPALRELGIELMDFQFKRINYSAEVQREIYNRMIAERNRIADKFRSEGEGEAAKIAGQQQRELKSIESEAYRKSKEITGKADASALAIYAEAYDQSAESRKFYEFLKTMDTYETGISSNDMLIISTDTDFYKYLKRASPE